MVTFAVMGRNEAAWLPNSLRQALAAAGPADRVWFVDGASADGSAEVAASLGVDVIAAPAGKGRAMAAVLERCMEGLVCFLDADIEASEVNIPRALVEAQIDSGADMVVAQLEWRELGFLPHTEGIFKPLAARLFPEALGRFGAFALTGFRVLNPHALPAGLPPGFGVEAHLNVAFAAADRQTAVVDVGRYWGPIRPKPEMAMDVAAAILDYAEELGRLDPAVRPAWDDWAAVVATVVNDRPPGRDPGLAFRERLAAAASRPFPPATAH